MIQKSTSLDSTTYRHPEVDATTAWYLHRQLVGRRDPWENAPAADWAINISRQFDLSTERGAEVLFALVGEEGKKRIFFQNPHLSEPIPYEDEKTYARKYLQAALSSKTLDIPDTRRAGVYGELVISLYDAHRMGGTAAAQKAWETVKRLRSEFGQLVEPVNSFKIRANDLKYLPIPRYILDEIPLYENGNNGLIGASGTGKSFFALHAAALFACALPKWRSVIYLAFEGLHGYSARWEAWKAHFHKDAQNLIFYSEPVNFMVANELHAFIETVRPDNPALIIVDTVARSMTGADENATRDMGIFVASVETVRRELNCTILLVHHTNKQGGIRGNSSLYNACDSVLFLKRVGAQIELHNEWESNGKNKHRPEEPTRYFKLLPKSVQIGDQVFESAVLVEAEQIIRETDHKLTTRDLKILEAVNGFANGLPAPAIREATAIPKSSIYRYLKPLVEHAYLEQTPNDHYLITERGKQALSAG